MALSLLASLYWNAFPCCRDLYKNQDHEDTVFRIDKFEGMNTFGLNFTNLTKLLEDSPVRSVPNSLF